LAVGVVVPEPMPDPRARHTRGSPWLSWCCIVTAVLDVIGRCAPGWCRTGRKGCGKTEEPPRLEAAPRKSATGMSPLTRMPPGPSGPHWRTRRDRRCARERAARSSAPGATSACSYGIASNSAPSSPPIAGDPGTAGTRPLGGCANGGTASIEFSSLSNAVCALRRGGHPTSRRDARSRQADVARRDGVVRTPSGRLAPMMAAGSARQGFPCGRPTAGLDPLLPSCGGRRSWPRVSRGEEATTSRREAREPQ
jgi:hypothetical protein